MSKKLSVLIPSRSEKYLYPTIRDCFEKAAGEVEVVVCLEGYWPEDWKTMTDKYPNLHTVHHGEAQGMRPAINSCAGSAISRGAKYLMKLDAHCLLDEGYDEKLLADIELNWIVVPRRKRLDPDAWTITEAHKPDIDYHYLSFPDDPQDFGGKGLNGKVWEQRAKERRDKPEFEIDDEMSSQGSAWLMAASYFQELELMDTVSYGPFWNEAQELFLKCWLSGGRGVINKKTFYAHLHKGKTHGRGYHLPESWLKTGATFTKLWMFNEAWPKQTLPFSWLIERFHPVPTWPENWEKVLYATRKPKTIAGYQAEALVPINPVDTTGNLRSLSTGLVIQSANYGIGLSLGHNPDDLDVTQRLQSLVSNNSLDIIVNNSTLCPGQNPHRGKKKKLTVFYYIDDGPIVTRTVEEKDWLIIGPAVPQRAEGPYQICVDVAKGEDRSVIMSPEIKYEVHDDEPQPVPNLWPKSIAHPPQTAPALNDFLIRKFSISPQRLRGPMPIELRDFHRNDLAQLFAELGFKRGAEIGVAEGKYSEVLLKANPECELLLVDPWHHYSENPQGKSKERHEYAISETVRKTKPYPNVRIAADYSMNVVRDIKEGELDFVYIDGHHSYPYVMCDIIEWTKRVRSGGIVAGDDVYRLNEKWGAGPMEAIYDYTRAMRISPWWLINAHKSTDFFFVKP